jgi:hypothetical protein
MTAELARWAQVFGRYLFQPAIGMVWFPAGRLRPPRSGNLNFYLLVGGAPLLIVLALAATSAAR